MLIQDALDVLNSLASRELQGPWMTNYRQQMIQTAILEVPMSIDMKELDGLSEDAIKKLVHNRKISALEDRLTALQIKLH